MTKYRKGKHVFVSTPTGGGKTLIYFFPAVASNGLTVITEPTTSLIQDQIKKSEGKHLIPAAYMYGNMSEANKQILLRELQKDQPNIKLLYCSPDVLYSNTFLRNRLKRLKENGMISSIVFDEAHCISNWSHEFRPAYIDVTRVISKEFQEIPIVMVATIATKRVRDDISGLLSLRNVEVVEADMNLPNLFLSVRTKDTKAVDDIYEKLNPISAGGWGWGWNPPP